MQCLHHHRFAGTAVFNLCDHLKIIKVLLIWSTDQPGFILLNIKKLSQGYCIPIHARCGILVARSDHMKRRDISVLNMHEFYSMKMEQWS